MLMNDLFVREDVRGAGIGRALIDRALDEARRAWRSASRVVHGPGQPDGAAAFTTQCPARSVPSGTPTRSKSEVSSSIRPADGA